ncbi:zinc finger CCCH domain-containing protein 31-like [Cornus florida]|uniref:zinc finger CCCH domain-containing protein 31-like n=1 Tax=Cornus florida TaxID=4283 RepID=UPI0028A16D50|nr:zinc finger CCCH domain-containing protein 31-like [Cornus florida]
MDSRKRVGPDAAFNPDRGVKKLKQALESSSTGKGSKMEQVTKFVSTAEMIKLGPNQATMYVASPPSIPDDSYQPAFKTRLCIDYNTAKGCKFGENCHFAHGICEFGKPFSLTFGKSHGAMASGRFAGRMRLPYSRPPLSINKDPITAQISVDASLAGAIYGHDDLKTMLGGLQVKIFIREHKSGPNLKNIELQGKFQQLKTASSLVIQQIERIRIEFQGKFQQLKIASSPVIEQIERTRGSPNYKI